jgi:ribosome-binding protein aMBF1 (putative translation factor)
MIKNERQYKITKAQAAKFEKALEALESDPKHRSLPPLLQKAERDALEGQLETLRAELKEYDALGPEGIAGEVGFENLPTLLIRARIAKGLTQQQLAECLDLDAQQIQRYEASDYRGANLGRIANVARALGLNMTIEAKAANAAKKAS